MSFDALIRILSLCVALAGTEMLHGIARTVLLAPRLGKERAIQVSIVSGSLLAFGVCYFLVPPIGLRETAALFGLGFFVALFMASFDVAVGRFLLKFPWPRIFRDFNPASGNYLLIGLLLLLFFPWLVLEIRAPG